MRATGFVVLAVLSLVSGRASADDPQNVREAKQHFLNGEKAYALGDYERAIAEYRAAYDADPRPLLLFDLGQAYQKAKRWDLAVHSLRQYLATAPTTSSRRGEAEDLLRRIEQERSPESPPTVEAPPTRTLLPSQEPPLPPHRHIYKRGWFWAVMVGAAAVAATGVALGVVYGTQTLYPTVDFGHVPAN